MAILKLAEPGSSLTMEVADVEVVSGDFGKQVMFENDSGDVLYVPESSVTRQLDRVGVAEIEDLRGRAVHFSRSTTMSKAGKPFWNLDKATKDDLATKTAPKTNGKPVVASALSQNEHNVGWLPGDEVETGAPPATNGKLGALRTTHARCFREVIENYVPVAAKAGLEISLEGASALTFQLYKMETDLR
jgi:hypothetical protein